MDNAFVNKDETGIDIWEQELELKKLMENRYHRRPRAVVFRRLMQEDPQFRKYFENLLTEKLNHVLTQDYLRTRAEYYAHIHSQLDGNNKFPAGIRDFIENRHEFVFKLMRKYFECPESYYCHVQGDNTMTYSIDGFHSQPGYRGIYFRDTPVQIVADDPSQQKKIAYWRINGWNLESSDNTLTHVINEDTTITPVFEPI